MRAEATVSSRVLVSCLTCLVSRCVWVWRQRPSAFLGLSPLASTKKSSWLQQFWHLAWRSGKDAARNVQLTIGKVRDPVF
jgi:hypothetical protein